METKNISKASFASQVLVYLSYKHLGDWQKIMADVCQHKIDVESAYQRAKDFDIDNCVNNFIKIIEG